MDASEFDALPPGTVVSWNGLHGQLYIKVGAGLWLYLGSTLYNQERDEYTPRLCLQDQGYELILVPSQNFMTGTGYSRAGFPTTMYAPVPAQLRAMIRVPTLD